MTLQELQAEFTAKHPQLVRMSMAHLAWDLGRELREELTQQALTITWRWVLKRHVAGDVNRDNAWRVIKDCLFHSVHHAMSRRLPPDESGTRGQGRQDAYDRLTRIGAKLDRDDFAGFVPE